MSAKNRIPFASRSARAPNVSSPFPKRQPVSAAVQILAIALLPVLLPSGGVGSYLLGFVSIRQARLKCSPPVSQDDSAGRLAVQGIILDQTAISRVENQTRHLMDYEIAAIAKSLKVSAGWLLGQCDSHGDFASR